MESDVCRRAWIALPRQMTLKDCLVIIQPANSCGDVTYFFRMPNGFARTGSIDAAAQELKRTSKHTYNNNASYFP